MCGGVCVCVWSESGRERRGWGAWGWGGDRACQSDELTDRQAVGTGDRGHPGPSWPNTGVLLWFYQTADPPSPYEQETLRQMNGEIMSGRKMGPGTRGRLGGRKMSNWE